MTVAEKFSSASIQKGQKSHAARKDTSAGKGIVPLIVLEISREHTLQGIRKIECLLR